MNKRIGDMNYASARVVATITKFRDMARFPVDSHELAIESEDGDRDASEMVYAADSGNIAVNPEAQVPGWKITGTRHAIAQHVYNTNYGDTSLGNKPKSTYSRYVFSTEIERPGVRARTRRATSSTGFAGATSR